MTRESYNFITTFLNRGGRVGNFSNHFKLITPEKSEGGDVVVSAKLKTLVDYFHGFIAGEGPVEKDLKYNWVEVGEGDRPRTQRERGTKFRYYESGTTAEEREEFKDKINRYWNLRKELSVEQEALKRLYLLNENITSMDKEKWENAHQLSLSSIYTIGSIFTGDGEDQYYDWYGPTNTQVLDKSIDLISDLGIPVTADQKNYVKRSNWDATYEGFTGSAGILLQFYLANKATAVLRAQKILKGGKTFNDMIGGWKATRYSNGTQTMSQLQINAAAAKKGLSVADYTRKYLPKIIDVGPNKIKYAQAILAESTIEGLKFQAIGGDFSTGFGFGGAAQVLGPLMGAITTRTFGKNAPFWLVNNAPRLEKMYQLSFKSPVNFMVGSEVGELGHAFVEDE